MRADVRPHREGALVDSVDARFRRILDHHADDTAVLADGELSSYGTLDEQSNRLANRLAAHGIKAGDVVGVVAERGARTVVSMLAAIKTGAAYVPLDPDAPLRRTHNLLSMAGCRIVVAPSHLAAAVASDDMDVVSLDRSFQALAGEPATQIAPERGPDRLLAVIFTSGSTGSPKPVAIEDRNLLSLLDSAQELMPRAGESALHVCAPQFDVAMLEVWATLLHGGRLVCHPAGRPDPRAVCRTVREHEVGWTAMATTTFHQLAETGAEPLARLRIALVGGEPMRPFYARRFRAACPHTRLLNIYGPAETTVFVTAHEVDHVSDDEPIPVGRAIPGSRLRVLDREGHLAPPGKVGQLCIGGPGVSRGYLHRPHRLAAEYIRDPEDPDILLYRSGDLAREQNDGTVELLGRIDDQVKVSGYRVNPQEIEATLTSHPPVRRAAVIGHTATTGRTQLVAFVETTDTVSLDAGLREFLAQRLPSYMIPRTIIQLDALPTGPTGKLDRAALVARASADLRSRPTTDEGDDCGSAIAGLFAEVLSLPAVGEHEDFMDLGGDSLLAVQLLARLRERFDADLSIAAVFELRTPAALEQALRSAPKRSGSSLLPLSARRHEGAVPASPSQAKALLISELAVESLPYQSQGMHRILGGLNVAALERSLGQMVRRHEILRTTFARERGVWMQQLHEPFAVPLRVEDLSGADDPEAALAKRFHELSQMRMDTSRLPLARWSLARLSDEDHALIAIEHHVVHDGVSTALFLRELSEIYRAESEGLPPRLSTPSVQYRDFAAWQHELAGTTYGRETLAYWARQLADPPQVDLPLDAPRAARQTYRGESIRLRLPPRLVGAVEAQAHAWRTTPFSLMLSAYCTLLGRYGDNQELIVGSGLANRRTLASEELIGMVVNTVALRIDMRGDLTARELTQRAQAVAMEAQSHQDIPFEQVVEHVAPQRRPDVSPLYQTLFSFHDAPVRTIAMAGATLIPTDALPNGSAKLDLSLTVIRRRGGKQVETGVDGHGQIAEDGLTLVWEYNSDLFERHTAQRMIEHYLRLLEQFTRADEDGKAALSLPLEDSQELEQRAAGPRGSYERDATIAQVFEGRALENPDAIAVSCEGREFSYRQLDRAANRLAHRLRSLGIERGARAAICMDRSVELIVAMLAIAKSGGAYVPFDPRDPKERVARRLTELEVPLLLSLQRHRDALPEPSSRLLFVDDELDLSREPDSAPPCSTGASDPAYLMFTSGSTGTPSAVVVPHRAIVRLVRGADYVQLSARETLLAMAPSAFDASTFEIWGALLNGARLALAPAGPLALADLAEIVRRERVTTMWLTAGLFQRVVDDRPELLGSIRQLLAGGDVLSADHVRRALARMPAGATLANGYGPTETTTFACVHRMRATDQVEQPIPIGRPISGSRAYILDSRRQPVPPGVTGELYIGGDGVALGYAGDPQRTAERYSDDPFDTTPGARIYRTGDLACWREDRTIEFLGRTDRQVKIRGFRIEPGEVESALREHPDVADAVVNTTDNGGERALAAYIVAASDRDPADADLRAHLARTLPAHAIPGAWARIERLPLTRNGKVDMAALPPVGARPPVESSHCSQEPGDELERRLIDLWRRSLELDAIGVDEDFFDLGGHSLLAVELFAAIERSLGIALPLASIFEAPTVRQMARCLRDEGWKKSPDSLVRLTSTGTRPPLFFVAAGDGNSVGFGALARRLGREQPFYALQPRGINGRARLHGTVEAMAARYVREIRHISPDGPYLLGGRCLGAVVAYEMARRLERDGREVDLLAVLDSGGPLWQTRPLADGTPFDEVMSSAIRRGSVDVELAEAFTPAGTERLFEQLREPVCVGADGTSINRYLHEIYLKRADVRDAYPNLDRDDAMWFVGWAWTTGREQLALSKRLLPAAANPEWESDLKTSRREALDALRKRISWRAVEALDLATGGRRQGAAVRRAERVRELSLRAWHHHRAGAYGGEITLIRSEEFQPGLERWQFLDSAGVVEHHVRGTHRSMLREPDVESLAACVKTLVDERIRA